MELWGWDDEYIIFKDIEATQRNGAFGVERQTGDQVINTSLNIGRWTIGKR